MRKITMATGAFIAVLAAQIAPTSAENIYLVGHRIQGRSYNELLKRWMPTSFGIWVGAASAINASIYVKGDTGLGDATVYFSYNPATMRKLTNAVDKAINWSKIAREHHADTTKDIACLGANADKYCTGSAYYPNQAGMVFFAANGGSQTDLILNLIDYDNQFIKTTIYLDEHKMLELKNIIAQIPAAVSKAAKATSAAKELFK